MIVCRVRDLGSFFDRRYSFVLAAAPFICFLSVYACIILFRTVMLYGATVPKCFETDQFWYGSGDYNWPLVGMFFLVFVLLLAWAITLAVTDWSRCRLSTKLIHGANVIAVTFSMSTFVVMQTEVQKFFEMNSGLHDQFLGSRKVFRRNEHIRDRCEVASMFAGRWRMVDYSPGYWNWSVPESWMELGFDGEASGADYSWQHPMAGYWRPPDLPRTDEPMIYRWGSIYIGDHYGPWTFQFDGDRLKLTSERIYPHEELTTIWLERIPNDEDVPNWRPNYFSLAQ